MSSASLRCAVEMIDNLGFPHEVYIRLLMSSPCPSSHLAFAGVAQKLFNFNASFPRLERGVIDSRSKRPILRTRGSWIKRITVARSGPCPIRQAWSKICDSKACSRLSAAPIALLKLDRSLRLGRVCRASGCHNSATMGWGVKHTHPFCRCKTYEPILD